MWWWGRWKICIARCFEEITIEVRLRVNRPSQVADLTGQHNSMANQQRVDHIPLRVNIINRDDMAYTHNRGLCDQD